MQCDVFPFDSTQHWMARNDKKVTWNETSWNERSKSFAHMCKTLLDFAQDFLPVWFWTHTLTFTLIYFSFVLIHFHKSISQMCSETWILRSPPCIEVVHIKSLQLAILGKPSPTKSSILLALFKREGGWGVKLMLENLCCRFCISVEAIWQYKLT